MPPPRCQTERAPENGAIPANRVGPMIVRANGWRPAATFLLGLVTLAAVMAGPPWLFMQWREQRLAELARPEAQADWDAFRERMRQESGRAGPVQRKVPKSVEPPERVWLRDYWRLAITAWVLFVGLLAAFLAVLVRGAARSAAQDGPRRDRHHEEQHERDADDTNEGKHAGAPVDGSLGHPGGAP
jgi:hypothetical protein